jgi:hypothetical protein
LALTAVKPKSVDSKKRKAKVHDLVIVNLVFRKKKLIDFGKISDISIQSLSHGFLR